MMKKLLLADDSVTIQKVVGIIFSTEEYQLEMTDDGNSAFDKALAEIPDLVIADISMPGKDGFELCRAIKSEPSLSNTSVLLLPGAFDHFDEAKAGEVCADGWLTKPFESQALLDKVSQLFEAEPVRMAGVAASVAEVASIEAEEDEAESGEDSSVSEAGLGLDDVEELEPSTEKIDEESPDDIWDAVSFAEDDLQKSSATDSVDSEDEVSFAAEEPESSTAEELQPEPFVDVDSGAEENIVELNDQVESDLQVESPASAEEVEPVDFSVLNDLEENEPLELAVSDWAEQSTEVDVAEEESVPFAEIVADDLSGDDEILDLSTDEIIEEVAPEEETVDEAAADEIEPFVEEETEPESVDKVADLVDEEIEWVEEIETLSAVAEDEDFYFDATAEDDEVVSSNAVAAVSAGVVGLAAGVAATHLGTDEGDSSATEQVEQQLRELSEDELKEVVAKVAGPMIEKLAAEMVEKITWEVVPDLAEAMISEEIRKIKEGA